MEYREKLYRAFVDKWMHPENPPSPQSDAELDAVESTFRFRLPTSYRDYMRIVGSGGPTIALLDCIVDNELNVADVNEILSTRIAIEMTKSWRTIGLPEQFIAFATDSAGNMFCFDAAQSGTERDDDAPIWFYDHDFQTTDMVAPDFASWIKVYRDLPQAA